MSNYSITLNFFIPKKIVKNLKKINIDKDFIFDWRDSKLCHCTIKSIYFGNDFPTKDTLDLWITKTQKILENYQPFEVSIKNISSFPGTVFANVYSEELIDLHKQLFKSLPSGQPQFEDNNYIPHVSILITSNVKFELKQDFDEFKVKEIQLMI